MDEKTLYVDLGTLKSKITTLTKLQRSIEDVQNTLHTLAGDAGRFWDGSAYEVFSRNQKSLNKDLSKLKDEVSQSCEKLTQAVAMKRLKRALRQWLKIFRLRIFFKG